MYFVVFSAVFEFSRIVLNVVNINEFFGKNVCRREWIKSIYVLFKYNLIYYFMS